MRLFSTKSLLSITILATACLAPAIAQAQSSEVTFHKDIEPILQRSCQSCHRPGGAGRLLKAGSWIVSDSVHLHSNGRDTTGHLEVGFRFHPRDYEPKYQNAFIGLGNGVDISIQGNKADQELHAYTTLTQNTKIITFEPHLHAPGERMCLAPLIAPIDDDEDNTVATNGAD